MHKVNAVTRVPRTAEGGSILPHAPKPVSDFETAITEGGNAGFGGLLGCEQEVGISQAALAKSGQAVSRPKGRISSAGGNPAVANTGLSMLVGFESCALGLGNSPLALF